MRGMRRSVVSIVAAIGLVVIVGGGTSWAAPAVKASAPEPEMIAARQRFFGLDNVDPETGAVRSDRVILSWFGITSYAASFNGHVVLLDAYVNRYRRAMSYTGTTPDEVAALRPETIF